ncbi:MAG: hypothetical protein ACK41Q_09220 [Candidatus Brocadia sp.]
MRFISKIKSVMTKQTRPSAFFNTWDGLFNSLADELVTLLSGTEEKFLSIGSRLQDFIARARELSEMSASVVRLTSGDEISTAIHGLREQLNKMTRYLDSSKEEAGNSAKKLQYILSVTENFDVICNAFKRIARILQHLSVFTLIENAHLGMNGIGFNILSDNVKKCAKLIDTKSSDIMDHAKSLNILVQKSLSRIQLLSDQQQDSAVNMLKDAHASLESITTLNRKSSEISVQIANRSAGIYQNIGDVVTSLQFHDITRQRIEHIGKTLACLQERLEESGQNDKILSANLQKEFVAWVGNICETQSSQHLHTKDDLVNAVDCVIKNLRGISKNVKDMIVETQTLSGSAHQSGTSFLSQVEEGISTVIHSLSENIRRGKEISASVGSAVNGMAKFLNEIEEIGAEIELIAFNAQVKAKRAGEEGKTLGAIAEEIQKLAVEARNYTEVVSGKLKAIAFHDEIFHADTDSILGNRKTESTGIASIFEDLLSSVRRINAEFIALLGRITESGQTLGGEIEALANQIIFHRETAQAIDGIASGFARIAVHSRKLVPSSAAHNKAARLEIQAPPCTKQSDLIHHTIQIDRVVHPPVVLTSSEFTRKNITKSDTNGDGKVDLGNNVEFF